jgi:hypothetical protein
MRVGIRNESLFSEPGQLNFGFLVKKGTGLWSSLIQTALLIDLASSLA